MLGVDQHGHTLGIQPVGHGLGDLAGQGLLVLQAAGEDLHHPRQLGDAHHPLGRHIGDVGLAEERSHVVLAVALHLDVAQHDDIVVAAVLEGPLQQGVGILGIAREPFLERLDHPARGLDQALAGGVVAGPGDQGAHGVQGLLARGAGLGRRLVVGEAVHRGLRGGPAARVC